MIDPSADILAKCLEAIEKGELSVEAALDQFSKDDPDLRELIKVAGVFRDIPEVKPRREFLVNSPVRLMNSIGSRKSRTNSIYRRPVIFSKILISFPRRLSFIIASLSLLIFLALGSGTVMAANTTIPGDWLYPVKLGIENMRLAIANQSQAVELRLQYVSRRTGEIKALTDYGRYDEIPAAAIDLTNKVQDAAQSLVELKTEEPILGNELAGEFRASLSNNQEVLKSLLEKVPSPAQPAIGHAIEVSNHEKESLNNTYPGITPGEILPSPTLPVEKTNNGNRPEATPSHPNGNPSNDGNPERPTQKPHVKPTVTPPGNNQEQLPGRSGGQPQGTHEPDPGGKPTDNSGH